MTTSVGPRLQPFKNFIKMVYIVFDCSRSHKVTVKAQLATLYYRLNKGNFSVTKDHLSSLIY